MPLIKMKATTQGSPNGISIIVFKKDTEYTVNDSLAKSFVDMGAASYVRQRKSAPDTPENKAMAGPGEDKVIRTRNDNVKDPFEKVLLYVLARSLM